jgi:CHAD domain-containing protein
LPNYTAKGSKKIYPVDPQQSLRENIAVVLPVMYDEFISLAETVLSQKGPKQLLHRMRINGKPLKYAMEIAEGAFGTEFKKCLSEVKKILELMGSIHDCDVNISELWLFLNETIDSNRTVENNDENISTIAIEGLTSRLKEKREDLFENFSNEISRWQKEDFRERLVSSMSNE